MCAFGHLITVYALSAYVFKRHLAGIEESGDFVEKLKLFVVGQETTCRVHVSEDFSYVFFLRNVFFYEFLKFR